VTSRCRPGPNDLPMVRLAAQADAGWSVGAAVPRPPVPRTVEEKQPASARQLAGRSTRRYSSRPIDEPLLHLAGRPDRRSTPPSALKEEKLNGYIRE